jgi:hypothetical protein
LDVCPTICPKLCSRRFDLNLWLKPAPVEVEVSAGCQPLAVLAGDGRVGVVEVEVMACAVLGCSMPPLCS